MTLSLSIKYTKLWQPLRPELTKISLIPKDIHWANVHNGLWIKPCPSLYPKGWASKHFHHYFNVEILKHLMKLIINSKESIKKKKSGANQIIQIKSIFSQFKVNETGGGSMGGEKRELPHPWLKTGFCLFPFPLIVVSGGLRFGDPGISRFVILRVRWRRGVK